MSGQDLTLSGIAQGVAAAVSEAAALHPGFMILNPAGAAPRVRHATLPDARRELRRLAEANPGQDFFILAPVLHARAQPPRATVRLAPAPAPTTQPYPFDDDQELPF